MNTKIDVLSNNNINIWTDEPEKEVSGIQSLEEVSFCHIIGGNPIFVTVDPRYDKEKVATKIRHLLTAEVPDIFKAEG